MTAQDYGAGALIAGEILAVALVQGHQLAPRPLYFRWGVDDWRPYIVECLLGVGIIVATLTRRRLRSTGVPTSR